MAEEKEIIWKCNNSKDNTMIKYYKIVIHKNTEKHLVYMRSNGKWEGFLGQSSFNKFIYVQLFVLIVYSTTFSLFNSIDLFVNSISLKELNSIFGFKSILIID